MGRDLTPDLVAESLAGRFMAIEPTALERMLAQLRAGTPVEAAARPPVRSSGGTAVIPIMGPISPYTDAYTRYFGGTGLDQLTAAFRQAQGDAQVKSIVFLIDSPGGDVQGVDELASEIFAARGNKPMTAFTPGYMMSAAYYLGSQAHEVVGSSTSLIGSIGVIQMHQDWSRAFEAMGITLTTLTSGKYKGETSPYQPLSDDAREHMQSQLDEYYDMFVAAVSRGREASVSDVRAGFGQGRYETASVAVRAKLADRVATLDQVLARHGSGPVVTSGAGAEDGPIPITTSEPDSANDLARLERINELALMRP